MHINSPDDPDDPDPRPQLSSKSLSLPAIISITVSQLSHSKYSERSTETSST